MIDRRPVANTDIRFKDGVCLHDLEPKDIARIQDLRKTLDNMVELCTEPVSGFIMLFLGPIYAIQRKRILTKHGIKEWIELNRSNLKSIAKAKTLEGSVAKIAISGFRPWIPYGMLLAVVLISVAVYFVVRYKYG